MSLVIPIPILADMDGAVTLLFIIFAFLSWLMNAIGGQKGKQRQKKPDWARQQAKQQQRVERPANRQLQSEIDLFLQEVKAKANAGRDQPIEVADILEPVPRPPKTKKRPDRPKQPQRSAKPGTSLSKRHLQSDSLGKGVGQHVSERIKKDRVRSEVERHLSHNVDQSVSEHLGAFSALTDRTTGTAKASPTGTDRSAPLVMPQDIVHVLRTPAGICQAIALTEILAPPKSRRRG